MYDGPGVVDPRHVISGKHRQHARRIAHRRQVPTRDIAMRDFRQAQRQMHHIGRLTPVIGIARGARDLPVGAVMTHGVG